jgi:hypothetical protein
LHESVGGTGDGSAEAEAAATARPAKTTTLTIFEIFMVHFSLCEAGLLEETRILKKEQSRLRPTCGLHGGESVGRRDSAEIQASRDVMDVCKSRAHLAHAWVGEDPHSDPSTKSVGNGGRHPRKT